MVNNIAQPQCCPVNMDNTINELKKYFTFDRIFNLVEYDNNMAQLYSDLKELQRESYDSNYRFVFLHYDTDYYISNDQPGLTLRNLQRLLRSLDISNYFCLILSVQHIQNQLDILRDQETDDVYSIYSIVDWTHPLFHLEANNVNHNVELISKNYICLNGIKRFHRTLLYGFLRQLEIVDQGIVSYGAFDKNLNTHDLVEIEEKSSPIIKVPANLKFIYTDNFTRIRDQWIIRDHNIIKMLASTPTESYKNFEDSYGRYNDYAISLSQQAFLYVISETVFDYPSVSVSEKTFKPIVAKRPFILASSPGSLAVLKDHGFKTFEQWWDESYDCIADPTERMKAIVQVINSIETISISELELMYREMQVIIDYIFNHRQTTFYNTELSKFRSACENNLRNR